MNSDTNKHFNLIKKKLPKNMDPSVQENVNNPRKGSKSNLIGIYKSQPQIISEEEYLDPLFSRMTMKTLKKLFENELIALLKGFQILSQTEIENPTRPISTKSFSQN